MRPSQKFNYWPYALSGLLVVAVIACLAFYALGRDNTPLTWEQRFNKQHGTAVLVDISDDQPQHLVSFDFEPEDVVTSYSGIVCWGKGDDPRMQPDAWAVLSNEVRKYGNGIKIEVVDTAEKADDGTPLKGMKMTFIPGRPLTPQQAQDDALKVTRQLWDHGPCRKN